MKRTANACKAKTKAKPKPKRKPGRPTKRTPAIEQEIVERIAQGQTLRSICLDNDKRFPEWRTVYDWMEADPDFSARIARARETGHDAIAEEALAIANQPLPGIETEEDEHGNVTKIKRGDMLGHRKLQIETRLKLLAKWNPKKYGERASMELTGKDGAPLNPTPDQAAQHILGLLSLAQPTQDTDDADAG